MGFSFKNLATRGFLGGLEKLLGGKAADVSKDLLKTTDLGYSGYNSGNTLTDEGLNDLRGYRSQYEQRLKDPLGAEGRGIFTRARGALSDAATQRAGAFNTRVFQTALQSGGTLSAAARAQLAEQNSRDIAQEQFAGNAAISDAEAQLTLSETSKLFDRMENISKTILASGENRSTQGLQTLLAALGIRLNRNAAIANTIVGSTGRIGGGGGGQATGVNPITGT